MIDADASLRVLIADDEEVARRRLRRLLGAAPGVTIVGECVSGQEVLEWLARAEDEVDVLLLDIRMPGLSGLETRALLPDDGPYVIFTTAHAEHAVAAFEVGAVDYLLKPIEAARLATALQRARGVRSRAEPSEPLALGRLAIPTAQGIVLVDPALVTHAIIDGALVSVHTDRGPVLTDYSLQELERRLPADRFARVHRRALVNLARIERLEPVETGGLWAITDRGARVPVSRQSARQLRRRLGLR
ncbi:MAG: response regulator [Nannocystaceae bacterium]|nr:response regulator [Myxococcales bacterium]